MRWLIGKLRRITSAGDYVPEVDGLRFVAILWVVLFHVWGSTPGHPAPISDSLVGRGLSWFIGLGHYGVSLFFVLSGYILSLPWMRCSSLGFTRERLWRYYLRRLTRLEPPYVMHLLILTVLFLVPAFRRLIWSPALLESLATPFKFCLQHQGASLFYLHQPLTGYANPLNCVLWSLEAEIQFYVFLPLVLVALKSVRSSSGRRFLLVILIGVAPLIVSMLGQAFVRPPVFLLVFHWFFTGILLADFLSDKPSSHANGHFDVMVIVSTVSFFVVVGMLHLGEGLVPLTSLLPFCVLGCYYGVVRGKIFKRLLSLEWVTVIGGMCYTIYLYHYVINLCFGGRLAGWMGVGNSILLWSCFLGLMSVLVVALCIPLFVFFERPFMKKLWYLPFFSKIWSRRPPPKEDAGSS